MGNPYLGVAASMPAAALAPRHALGARPASSGLLRHVRTARRAAVHRLWHQRESGAAVVLAGLGPAVDTPCYSPARPADWHRARVIYRCRHRLQRYAWDSQSKVTALATVAEWQRLEHVTGESPYAGRSGSTQDCVRIGAGSGPGVRSTACRPDAAARGNAFG
ncbi:hypothetical protein D3C77_293240 [compost metagenome]